MVSISNFLSKYLLISWLLGLIGTITPVVKYPTISPSIWGLPVTNIHVLGDSWRMSFSDSRSDSKFSGSHSSNPSIQMKTCHNVAITCNSIYTISGSLRLYLLSSLSAFCDAVRMCLSTSSLARPPVPSARWCLQQGAAGLPRPNLWLVSKLKGLWPNWNAWLVNQVLISCIVAT